MLFVVSTGRSGSQTLSMVLSQSPDMLCLHEPHPQLVRESASFHYGRLGLPEAVELLRRTRPAELEGRRYGETNNRLALMLPVARAAFPEAQMVWLLRDGRGFVASELQRGAYRSVSRLPWRRSKWDRWRLSGAAARAVGSDEWERWSTFEKICWQWGYVNRLIRKDLAGLGPERVRVLRIEDLGGQLPELCDWLGITKVDFHIPRSNARREVPAKARQASRHPNAVARVTGWEGWTPQQRATFERHAGELMDEHYPGWRSDDGQWQPVRAEEPPPPADGEAVLRYELARALVERQELRSEIAELKRSPVLLLTHAGLSLRNRLRR